ncbi:MAG TPA: hybrid sensor histidine kinase/response regulator [Burkholderiales bacterium]|nr:hybrid sensor histidine kinase/response regulator [Burkholderiales bacterium]
MSIAELVRVEQARLLHQNVPTAALGGLAILAIVAVVFSPVVPAQALMLWAAAAVVLNAFRMWRWSRYRNMPADAALASRWLSEAATGALCSGLLWGAGSFFMLPPERLDFQLAFAYAVVMMSVTCMFSYGPHYRSFVSFCVPCLFPLIPAMAAINTPIAWGVAIGSTIFLTLSLGFMRSFTRMFEQSLHLRFRNVDLVDALTTQKEAAETANIAKSRFLAVASHDLRQPMHALNLYLGAFDSVDIPARGRTILSNLHQCAHAMDDMFRALLDISRLDAGSVQVDARAFNIDTLLDRIRMEFEPQALAKGLKLRVAPCSATLRSDPALVERILRNFASNAVTHTSQGKILIGCRRAGASLRVSVYDTGPGIPDTQHKAIFDEFYQAGNPERDRSKGLGLGLAIVDRLARLLIAPIILRSQVGRGSLFAVELQRTSETAVSAQTKDIAPRSLNDVHVVIVDDEATILNATSLLLGTWGCKVTTAASLIEALERLGNSERAPDILLCDYRLRGNETGVQVVEALRAEFNTDIPALLITGDVDTAKLRDIERSGLPLIHKPLTEQALRSSLSKLLVA